MIEELINQTGLSEKEVAELLFPENTWPIHALRRLRRNPELIKAWQLEKLKSIVNK